MGEEFKILLISLCVVMAGCTAPPGTKALDCRAIGRVNPDTEFKNQAADLFAHNERRALFIYASAFYDCPCEGAPLSGGDVSNAFAGGAVSSASASGDISDASASGDISDASASGDISDASAGGDISDASAGGGISGASAGGGISGASAGGGISGASAGGGISGASAGGGISGASAGGGVSGASAGGGVSAFQCVSTGKTHYALLAPVQAEIVFYNGVSFQIASLKQ